jgi:plastocyanin
MKPPRISLLLLLTVLLAGAAIACGGDDEADTGTPSATSAAPTREDEDTPDATADDTGSPTTGATGALDDEVQVQAADFSFDPDNFTVPAGVPVKIEVRNSGAFPHTLTVYSDEEYTTEVAGADTGNIEASEDADFTTTLEAGQYFFRCDIHPTQMEGDLTAQ